MASAESGVEGIYEVGIGVTDPIAAIHYWQQFGYRVGQVGELDTEGASELYGVNSPVRSIRLSHQTADHGLIRLMVWRDPTNKGLGTTSMRVKGNRWATTLTADLLNLLNHAEIAQAAGLPIRYSPPRWEVIYRKGRSMQPFVDEAIGVREMMMLQPLTRQILFQRFGYAIEQYGAIDLHSSFKTSQFTHMGLVVQDDSKESLRFYEEVLGLLRVRDDVETGYESLAGRDIFELQPGERFWVTAFDDPRSSIDFRLARSGRLYIVRFAEAVELGVGQSPVGDHRFEQSRPGCLGMSLYTYRSIDLPGIQQRIREQAKDVTAIVPNEFGEPSFSFVSPDGYFWTLIG